MWGWGAMKVSVDSEVASMQTWDVNIIASWLWLDSHVSEGVFYEYAAHVWSIFPLDCFGVTSSVKLSLVIINSFVCVIFFLLLFIILRRY